MARLKPNRNIPALDAAGLERLALHYVERYATTRAKLTLYLERKLYERGWNTDDPPPVEALVQRMADNGYVDDRQFAEMRAAALSRRGYGKRRIDTALKIAGIDPEDAEPALALVADQAWEAVLAFARRRRFGPFAQTVPDEADRRRAFASMLRAGHPVDLVRHLLALQKIPDNRPAG